MKSTKLIAAALLAIAALWTAGPAGAAGKNGHAAASVRNAGYATRFAATGHGAGMRNQNRRFFRNSFQVSPFGSGYYGGYGGQVYQNPDEADWAEQWTSLYEDNDGPYARSTRENPPGGARMWEFPEK